MSESQVNYFEYYYKIPQTSPAAKIVYRGVILTKVSFPIAIATTLPRVTCNPFLTSWDYRLQFKPQALHLMVRREKLRGHEIQGKMREKKVKKNMNLQFKKNIFLLFLVLFLKTLYI